jgi:hypothetical protein
VDPGSNLGVEINLSKLKDCALFIFTPPKKWILLRKMKIE